MSQRVVILSVLLGAAAGLWLWSRTRAGQVVVMNVVDRIAGALPRGLRNNNPGNIDWIAEPSKRWRGMIRRETPEEGGRFAVFDTPANGVRAIGKELELDARRGVRTVAGLIANWAPSNENNTSAYTRAVSRAIGVQPDDAIDVSSYLPRLVAAIIHHENGVQPYGADELEAWVYS